MNFNYSYLRKIRLEAHLTQEYLAYVLGMSQSHYNRLENGKLKLQVEYISKIAKAFNIPVYQLVPGFLDWKTPDLDQTKMKKI